MSLPMFPNNPGYNRDDVINLVMTSIAMEELGLSHILNAEGEKLQYVLGTLSGQSGPAATINDILAVNDSVYKVLETISQTQLTLTKKLGQVLGSTTSDDNA